MISLDDGPFQSSSSSSCYHRSPKCCASPNKPAWKRRTLPSIAANNVTAAPAVRVGFVDEAAMGFPNVVTATRTRPRTTVDESAALYYSSEDIRRFSRELRWEKQFLSLELLLSSSQHYNDHHQQQEQQLEQDFEQEKEQEEKEQEEKEQEEKEQEEIKQEEIKQEKVSMPKFVGFIDRADGRQSASSVVTETYHYSSCDAPTNQLFYCQQDYDRFTSDLISDIFNERHHRHTHHFTNNNLTNNNDLTNKSDDNDDVNVDDPKDSPLLAKLLLSKRNHNKSKFGLDNLKSIFVTMGQILLLSQEVLQIHNPHHPYHHPTHHHHYYCTKYPLWYWPRFISNMLAFVKYNVMFYRSIQNK